jgi:hypothetical protein
MTNMDGKDTNDFFWFPINLEKFRGLPINSHPGAEQVVPCFYCKNV